MNINCKKIRVINVKENGFLERKMKIALRDTLAPASSVVRTLVDNNKLANQQLW